jgi:hypothetical protein
LEASPEESQQLITTVAEILNQHCIQILGKNPPTRQLLAVPLFWKIRVTTEGSCAFNYCFVERHFLKRMQGVVMNERRDWPLGRKKVRRFLNLVPQPYTVWASNLGTVGMQVGRSSG